MANLLASTVSDTSIKTATARCRSGLGDPAPASGGCVTAPPESSESGPAASPPKAPEEEPEVARRLRAQYAEISQLAGGLAHEIKNPLSTVSLNLDLLA